MFMVHFYELDGHNNLIILITIISVKLKPFMQGTLLGKLITIPCNNITICVGKYSIRRNSKTDKKSKSNEGKKAI